MISDACLPKSIHSKGTYKKSLLYSIDASHSLSSNQEKTMSQKKLYSSRKCTPSLSGSPRQCHGHPSHKKSFTSQPKMLSPTKSYDNKLHIESYTNSHPISYSKVCSSQNNLSLKYNCHNNASQSKSLSLSKPNTSQKNLSPNASLSLKTGDMSLLDSSRSKPSLSTTQNNQNKSYPNSNSSLNTSKDHMPIFETSVYKYKVSLPFTKLITEYSPKPLNLLIDTGASVSIVKLSCLINKPNLSQEIIKLKGINDSESCCESLGAFDLKFKLCKETYEHKFHVINDDINLKYDGIIGTDFLRIYCVNIDYDSKYMSLCGHKLPILFNTPTYVIPARTEAVIECMVSNEKTELHKLREALVLDQVISDGVYLANCIVSLKPNNRVNISVLNTTESDVHIRDFQVHLTQLDSSIISKSSDTHEIINTVSSSPSDRISRVLSQIRHEHLNAEEKKLLLDCCSEYNDIFYLDGDPLTCTNAIQHSINTKDASPIHVKSYRFPECHKQEVEKQIKKMLDQNIIKPSNSPWSAPVWVVPKKIDASGQKKWRIVIDYRRLNDVTINETFPIPLISDILDQLGHSKYFTTLDLVSGFHQISLNPADSEKTGFTIINTNGTSGHFEFNRMPFGLKNAPSTFQRLMNTVLSGLQGLHCFVYLDDCILYSHDLQGHMHKLRLVFDRFRNFNLRLQPDKCEFLRREVTYLGHVITDKGVSPNPDKVKAVSEFPTPKNAKDIKSFLGLTGYYRRFIDNFSKLTKPLTCLLKKDAAFHWNIEQEQAFALLKDKLISAPLLQYPDFSQPFVVTTDASNYAVGAVLSQGPVGKDKPIAYASRTLNKAEGNYSTTEKELLAILFAIKTFRPYLYGNKFKIITDHRPLVWLFNVKDPGSRLIRWRLKLEEYDYEIVYKQGKLNSNADALSRYPIHAITHTNLNKDTYEKYFKLQFTNSITTNTVIEEHAQALHLTKLKLIACPTSLDFDSSMPNCEEILSQIDNSTEILESEREANSVLAQSCNNKSYYFLFTKIHHYDEVNYKTIYDLLIKLRDCIIEQNPDESDLAISDFSEPFSKLSFNKIYNMIAFVFHNTNLKIHIYKNQLIYPTPVEVPKILKENHDSAIAGHPGVKRMLSRIQASYYWKSMRSDIENYVKNCKLCQVNKPLRKSNKAPMEITSTSTKPFERLALDIVGPLPEAGFQNFKFILTLQDDLTKFTSAYPMISSTTEEIARNLVHFMSLFGFPKTILTDLGTCFTSSLFKQLMEILKVKSLFTTPYHPQTNGALERSHATLKEYLKSFVNENQNDWHCYLFTAILSYNTTPHCTTNFTPFELLYGYKPTIPNSLYETSDNNTYDEYIRALRYRMRFSREKAIQNIINSKEKSKEYYDVSTRDVSYKSGDMVYLKHHHRLRKALSPIWKGPYKIVKVHNKHNITLQVGRKHTKYHVNEIKPAHST